MKRATIADVAARAGVSKSTVSHALSGKRPVAPATRRRIEQAIAALDYQPHPVAQRLAGGRTRTIGFVFPLYSPHIAGLEMKFITGAANVINQADYAFLLLTHPQKESDHLLRFIRSGLADGFILMQVQLEDPRVEMLRRAALPFVLIGRCADNSGLTYVDVDIDRAITDCVVYLAGLGHRSIAYLHQDDPELGFMARAQRAFRAACQRHQLTSIMEVCDLSADTGRAALHAVLNRQPDTTAVIVWNDLAAWGVVQAAQERQLTIPAQLSLISFDYATLSQLAPFQPTAVDIRPSRSAALAAKMLISRLEGEALAHPQQLLTHDFIEGASTAPPPA